MTTTMPPAPCPDPDDSDGAASLVEIVSSSLFDTMTAEFGGLDAGYDEVRLRILVELHAAALDLAGPDSARLLDFDFGSAEGLASALVLVEAAPRCYPHLLRRLAVRASDVIRRCRPSDPLRATDAAAEWAVFLLVTARSFESHRRDDAGRTSARNDED